MGKKQYENGIENSTEQNGEKLLDIEEKWMECMVKTAEEQPNLLQTTSKV